MASNEADESIPWFNLAPNDSCWLRVTVSKEAKKADHIIKPMTITCSIFFKTKPHLTISCIDYLQCSCACRHLIVFVQSNFSLRGCFFISSHVKLEYVRCLIGIIKCQACATAGPVVPYVPRLLFTQLFYVERGVLFDRHEEELTFYINGYRILSCPPPSS